MCFYVDRQVFLPVICSRCLVEKKKSSNHDTYTLSSFGWRWGNYFFFLFFIRWGREGDETERAQKMDGRRWGREKKSQKMGGVGGGGGGCVVGGGGGPVGAGGD